MHRNPSKLRSWRRLVVSSGDASFDSSVDVLTQSTVRTSSHTSVSLR